LTAKARTEQSSALPRCAWLSNTVREIEYQFLQLNFGAPTDGLQRAIPNVGGVAHPAFRTFNDDICHLFDYRVLAVGQLLFAQGILESRHHSVDDLRFKNPTLQQSKDWHLDLRDGKAARSA
jgi:hypothetical protein